jgi:Uma2 family endonuclease
VELLNGEMLEITPAGKAGAYCSDEAVEYLIYLFGNRAKVRQTKPITLLQSNSELEPDIAVVERR